MDMVAIPAIPARVTWALRVGRVVLMGFPSSIGSAERESGKTDHFEQVV
jgi:hypothetical protein